MIYPAVIYTTTARTDRPHLRHLGRLILGLAALLTGTGLKADPLTVIHPDTVLVDSFQGWGVSLCWWGKVVGGYSNRNEYADLVFKGLKLDLVRYNIGGGENPDIRSPLSYRARIPGFEPKPGVWDWQADAGQRWMLHAALARGVRHVVAFANSPPYWMTVSRSVSGAAEASRNNLRPESEDDFAAYLATVAAHLTASDGVKFDAITPMNEPTGPWWKLGNHQEGDFMSHDQQARMIVKLRTALKHAGLPLPIVASEDNDEQSAISSVRSYDARTLADVSEIVTHTYGANNPAGLRRLAASLHKPLSVSEYGDGDESGLTMARRIRDDLTDLHARAWVYWQAVDGAPGWGLLENPLAEDGDDGFDLNEKYYVLGQFSRFIRPGFQILSAGDTNSLAAYDATNHVLVIVTVNDTAHPFGTVYDLSAFAPTGGSVQVWRTSRRESLAPAGTLPVAGGRFATLLPQRTVTTHVISHVFLPERQPLKIKDPAADPQ